MKSIQVQLTTKCNERCFMCRKYTWDCKEINIDTLKEKILKYKDCTFTFSGGDPLAYSKLNELNKILEDNSVTYQVFTNMNYNLNDDMIKFLDNAKFVQVSLDGSNYATYKNVRRCVENGFDTVKSNIEKYKDKVKLNVTVSNRNYFDVRNLYEKFGNYNLRFFAVHTDKDAMLEGHMISHIYNQFNDIEIPSSILNMLDVKEPFNGKCFVKNEHRIIDEEGKEYPCCRAINDNGEDWCGKFEVSNLESLEDENVLYEFCKGCDRYRKFNNEWDKFKDRKEVFL